MPRGRATQAEASTRARSLPARSSPAPARPRPEWLPRRLLAPGPKGAQGFRAGSGSGNGGSGRFSASGGAKTSRASRRQRASRLAGMGAGPQASVSREGARGYAHHAIAAAPSTMSARPAAPLLVSLSPNAKCAKATDTTTDSLSVCTTTLT